MGFLLALLFPKFFEMQYNFWRDILSSPICAAIHRKVLDIDELLYIFDNFFLEFSMSPTWLTRWFGYSRSVQRVFLQHNFYIFYGTFSNNFHCYFAEIARPKESRRDIPPKLGHK